MSEHAQDLKRTPLFHAHKDLGARMTGFGGWEMPLTYSSQLNEHAAVRTHCGMFDVSHMGQVRFRGEEALAYLQMLVPADIGALKDGEAKYTQLLNDHAGVIDDLIISRVGPQEYFAVVNASPRAKDVEWMKSRTQVLGFDSVEITDESDQWAMIAVQGPEALHVLERVVKQKKWSDTPAFTLHPFLHQGELHLLSRTGYTGEVGGELLCPPDQADWWWSEFLEAGVVPCGLAARDSLRLEAGYCLYGNDLDDQTTPLNARLNWTIGWKKEAKFIGRTILENQKAEGIQWRLMGIVAKSRRPLRHGDKVLLNGAEAGVITSGGYSPGLEAGIAMGYLRADLEKDALVEIAGRGTPTPGVVTRPPFVKTSLSK